MSIPNRGCAEKPKNGIIVSSSRVGDQPLCRLKTSLTPVLAQEPAYSETEIKSLCAELIMLICDFLEPEDIFSLSRTCTRLNCFLLPPYLARHGVHNPSSRSICLDSDQMQVLPALRSAFFIRSLDHLSCKFNSGIATLFARELEDLARFILRLESINEVVLDFSKSCFGIFNDYPERLQERQFDWEVGLRKLFNVLMASGQCQSLLVKKGYFVEKADESAISLLLTTRTEREGASGRMMNLVRHALKTMKRPARKGKAQQDCVLGKGLETLHIHSDILFTKLLRSWTINTLNSSNIRTLSFQPLGRPGFKWPAALAPITIPTLTHFSAKTPYLTFPDFISFVSRHPRIVTLDLHTRLLYPHWHSRASASTVIKLSLPYLTTLSGGTETISHFLSHLVDAPKLSYVKLDLPVHQRVLTSSDFEELTKHLAMITQNWVVTKFTLRFSIPSGMDTHGRTRSGSGSSQRSYNTSETVGIDLTDHAGILRVECLDFCTDSSYDFSKWVLRGLATWLSQFEGLREVRFASGCIGWKIEEESRDQLWNACPLLRVVGFGSGEFLRGADNGGQS